MSLTILLDMDGVVADFVTGVCNAVGRSPQWPENADLAQHFGMSQNEMWSHIDAEGQEFWSRLEVLPWARRLWELCNKHGRTLFCTSPSANPQCAAGKLRWMQNFTSDRFFREFVITPRKEVCADSHTLLIDDHERNCERFIEAGGRAFLWPMPWNCSGQSPEHFSPDGRAQIELLRETLGQLELLK